MARKNRAKKVVRSDQEDRLGALPDGVLHHILGFLPAHEAVRTSVLAPRWRDLWMHVRRLQITSPWEEEKDYDENKLSGFINALLLPRGRVNLDEVKLDCDSDLHKKEHVNILVRHVLMCQPKVLTVYICGNFWISRLEGSPLVSRHLRKLELDGVHLKHKVLDFASCPALEVLEMKTCMIKTERIFLQSIKNLCIESSTFTTSDRDRTHISALSLIRLKLHGFRGKAPLLESMPSLETASVKSRVKVDDSCDKGDSKECCGICADCCGDDDYKGRCVLLVGLSSAVNLELTAYPGMEPKFTAQMDGNNPLEKSAVISKYLKIIKIKCNDVDDRHYGKLAVCQRGSGKRGDARGVDGAAGAGQRPSPSRERGQQQGSGKRGGERGGGGGGAEVRHRLERRQGQASGGAARGPRGLLAAARRCIIGRGGGSAAGAGQRRGDSRRGEGPRGCVTGRGGGSAIGARGHGASSRRLQCGRGGWSAAGRRGRMVVVAGRFLSLIMGVLLMMGTFDVSRLSFLVTATVSVKSYACSDGTIFMWVV
ncbi:hypothetical protein PR202_ga24637 [Eleusine coracana subsp. coracana]|uniref:F-box domain-containing protein n=1 Tax=Eleusine coracana subsp. coracana TaxID=191504 RepID=A0AAV5D9V1_ELECO|nr:hypothetical protein PR202_ga24637 [Eleusine coracana subsp. coracana]